MNEDTYDELDILSAFGLFLSFFGICFFLLIGFFVFINKPYLDANELVFICLLISSCIYLVLLYLSLIKVKS